MSSTQIDARLMRGPMTRFGAGVLTVRFFGWTLNALLAAFMINNFLTFSVTSLPGASTVLDGNRHLLALAQAAIYAGLIIAAAVYVLSTTATFLRDDSKRITAFNTFFVRAAFWAVLLVGLADASISFLRVEGLLPQLFGDQMATNLGRSAWRGPYIHVPLIIVSIFIAMITRGLGFIWLALLIVVAELAIVLTRFVFSYEQAFMGDLVRFWYAALFLFASAYTLLEEGHVRVDVFYAGFKSKTKGLVNAVGSLLLGLTMCWCILLIGMAGKSAIITGAVMNFEISQSGFGMFVKYQMAAFLGVFAVTMAIQFVAYFFDAVADYRGDPGKREVGIDSAEH